MSYVDGFVLPVPKKNISAYCRMSKQACKVWMDLGALDYRECVGDDMKIKGMTPFSAYIKPKAGETIVFAWILYKLRAHRDKVNSIVMKDPRIAKMVKNMKMPFDCKRMLFGGFKTIVEAAKRRNVKKSKRPN